MASLYLDENFSLAVQHELRRHGHFVTDSVEERKLGASDALQLIHAAENGWTIVTHNRDDVHLLHEAWFLWSHRWHTRQSHRGILVLEQFHRQAPGDIVRALVALLQESSDSLANSLYEWRRLTGWVRFPD